ncbi:MAG: hypothetical protein FJZ43_01870 [Candidatus Staskawiczbacteria bacterium]|nr:hypothetical protein [Candidatus Staskawiczbacteria bacterium]
MIPKNIFTIWISEKDLPEKYKKWCKTHEIAAYNHYYITLKDCIKINSNYLRECLKSKHWVKATDYVRMHYLYNKGGIYLDCDMKVLKPFDDLLSNSLFLGREDANIIANSIIGAESKHPLIKKYLELVENNFKGSGDMIFEPAERLLTDLILEKYGKFGKTTTYSSDYFFPTEDNNKNSYTFHNFIRSWK